MRRFVSMRQLTNDSWRKYNSLVEWAKVVQAILHFLLPKQTRSVDWCETLVQSYNSKSSDSKRDPCCSNEEQVCWNIQHHPIATYRNYSARYSALQSPDEKKRNRSRHVNYLFPFPPNNPLSGRLKYNFVLLLLEWLTNDRNNSTKKSNPDKDSHRNHTRKQSLPVGLVMD